MVRTCDFGTKADDSGLKTVTAVLPPAINASAFTEVLTILSGAGADVITAVWLSCK